MKRNTSTVKRFLTALLALFGAVVVIGWAAVPDDADVASPVPTTAPTESVHADELVVHARLQEAAYEGGFTACRRCHLREYRSWQRTPHANALEVLPEENRTDPACLRCHTTGYGTESGFTSVEATPRLAGVGCEVCHGPGSVYKDEEIMKSREASLAAGLRLPDERTCRGCHNSDSPSFSGTFDFEAAKAEGVHTIGR